MIGQTCTEVAVIRQKLKVLPNSQKSVSAATKLLQEGLVRGCDQIELLVQAPDFEAY